MKQIVLSLFLFLSLSLQAQAERRDTLMSDSLQTDSVIPAKPSAFKRAIRKFMNFSDFDTLYISPNRYNYALMTTHFSNFVNPEKPDVPLNKNDAFQKVQKRRVQEKR